MSEQLLFAGDEVTWVSQSQGYRTQKTGKVVEFVQAGKEPRTKLRSDGWVRDHGSYVVAVPGKTPKSATKMYWPRVHHLTLVRGFDE